jgi:SCY1-like protein 2
MDNLDASEQSQTINQSVAFVLCTLFIVCYHYKHSSKMLAVASGLFGKTSSLSAYTLHSSTPAGSPASSSTNLPSLAATPSKGFVVGLWRVVGATHKTTNKDVSVWIFDKKVLEGVRGATQTREWAIEQLKKEVMSYQPQAA